MIHGYISNKELKEMLQSNREALVIYDIQTKDIDEYICSMLAYFGSLGINSSIFTQPKIIKHTKDNKYTIIFIVRASIEIDTELIRKLNECLKHLDNSCTFKQYMTKRIYN